MTNPTTSKIPEMPARSIWRPLSDMPFDPRFIVIAAVVNDDPRSKFIFLCEQSKGEFYPVGDGMPLSLTEENMTPVFWAEAPADWSDYSISH